MFAAAHDQENLAHIHQTAAAAKPLNQGNRGAKTPAKKGPKTPFRVPLNDENAPLKTGKSILKANGGNLDGAANDGKQAKDGGSEAFVTPAGPRNRAPLGMKTTNAKTKAFQTPAPLIIDHGKENSIPKSLSPRMRRPKVKVHQAKSANAETHEEEPEIEYMPPQPIPLRDDPDDFPADKQYPMFLPENITCGLYATFSGADDEDIMAKREQEEAEAQAKHDKAMDDLVQKAIDNDPVLNSFSSNRGPDGATSAKASLKQARGNEKPESIAKRPSSSASKSAVSALSRPINSSTATHPTASTAQKAKTPAPHDTLARKHPATAAFAAGNVPSQRTISGNVAASRTTLGYAQGRAVSSNVRRPLQDVVRDARPQKNGRSTSAGELKKVVQASSRSNAKVNSRKAAHQKENQPPRSRAPPTSVPPRADSELENWFRDNETGFDFSAASREESAGERFLGDLPTLDEMLREEAMQEFRLELPEGF